MKKQSKFLIGGIVAVVIIAGVLLATNTDLFKGSLGSANQSITRAQLAELIAKELMFEEIVYDAYQGCFDDISNLSESEQAYICFLKEKGVMSGIMPGNNFKPQALVNRAEAAVIFNKAFAKYIVAPVAVTVDYKPYSDVSKTDWFEGAVESLAAHDVLDVKPGPNSKFYPSKPLTNGRAQYWMGKIKEKSDVL